MDHSQTKGTVDGRKGGWGDEDEDGEVGGGGGGGKGIISHNVHFTPGGAPLIQRDSTYLPLMECKGIFLPSSRSLSLALSSSSSSSSSALLSTCKQMEELK